MNNKDFIFSILVLGWLLIGFKLIQEKVFIYLAVYSYIYIFILIIFIILQKFTKFGNWLEQYSILNWIKNIKLK